MPPYKNLLFLLLVCCFASCKVVMFDTLPGTEQKTIPVAFQGSYYLKVPSKWFQKTPVVDTVFFDISPNSFVVKANNEAKEIRTDSSNQLRVVGGKHLVLVSPNIEYPMYWNFLFLEPTPKGARFYYIQEDETVSAYFKRKQVTQNNAGDSVFVYQANDSLLTVYFEKVLRKKESLELIRLK